MERTDADHVGPFNCALIVAGKGYEKGETPALSAKRERRERDKKLLVRLRYSRETACGLLPLSRHQTLLPPTLINAIGEAGNETRG